MSSIALAMGSSINTFSQKTLKAFLAKNQFQLISSGWNSHGLWVIAQKTNKKNLLVQVLE